MNILCRIANGFFLCGFFILCSFAHAVTLQSIQVRNEPGKTLVILSCSDPCTPKLFRLIKPERIVVDFPNTTYRMKNNAIPLDGGFIAHIRSGYPTPNNLRLVFDMNQPVLFNTTPSASGLYIEFTAEKTLTPVNEITSKPTTNPKKSMTQGLHQPSSTTQTTVQRFLNRNRNIVIVLDPGHGGKDPGAIGANRNVEKNITLAIALKLKQLIERQPGMRAVLTRKGDYYVGLRERLRIARKHSADIFISIHADAFINEHSSGASVFALSPRGATSEAAHWLAEKENNSELGGVNLAGLDDQNGVIRTVLLDLSQTATINASLQMGSRVLEYLDNMTKLHNAKVEQARFVVLKSPDIPSILIETGFISNPHEEKNLIDPSYQMKMAQAIVKGLQRYFGDHPAQAINLQPSSTSKIHVVTRGQSLSLIAARYHVTLAQLKKLNQLSNESVKIGQTLHIPES
ncbi:MAG: N-acetylmuramoyl-L-alanine amidase [Legionella sp.]